MPRFGASDVRPRSVGVDGLKANMSVDVQCESEDRALARNWSMQWLHRSPAPLGPLILGIPAQLARRAWHERELYARNLTDRRRNTRRHGQGPGHPAGQVDQQDRLGMSTGSAHPEPAPTDGYFAQVIFIDSMSFDISRLDRSGMRCPGAKAISAPLKSLSL